MPSEPVSMAAVSDRTSPNRLSVRMTSKLLGAPDQLHGAIVGQSVLEFDVRIVLGDGLDDFIPENARLHDVLLVDGVHLLAAGAGKVEGDAGDAVDLVGLVDLGVDGALLAVAEIGDLLGLADE